MSVGSSSVQIGFLDEATSKDESLSGNITGSATQSSYSGYRGDGFGSQFLRRRGFDWLMDVEDEEENQTPILEELDIDVKDIYYKVRCVLLPHPRFGLNRQVLRDKTDFWGPLLVVILYAIVSLYGQFRVVSWIITIWLLGSSVIYVIARSLGGEVNYAQCLGVIGYSLLPMTLFGLLNPALSYLHPYVAFLFRFIGVVWSSCSAGSLLCLEELQKKRILLLYPILLLYIYFLSLYTGA